MSAAASTNNELNGDWLELESNILHGPVIPINANEFIVAARTGIYKYNAFTATMHKLTDYPKSMEIYNDDAVFDSVNQRLFVRSGQLRVLDLKSKSWSFKTAVENKCREVGSDCKLLFVDGDLHIVGGDRSANHFVSADLKHWKVQHTFPLETYKLGLAYLPSKQRMLAIGGHTHNEQKFGIHEYSFVDRKWRKIQDVEFDYHEVSAAVSKDERHVILCSVYNNSYDDDNYSFCKTKGELFVLDVADDGKYALRQSKIRLPKFGRPHVGRIVITGDKNDKAKMELLVLGYIRQLQFDLGMDVVRLIAAFAQSELLHYLKAQQHFVIPLHEVIAE